MVATALPFTPRQARDPAVCIVSYRRPDLLRLCLQSVRLHLPQSQVYVWDNWSPDSQSIRKLSSDFPEVKWSMSAANIGFAAAVNRLADLSAPANILLLNPDAELRNGLGDVLSTIASESRVAAVAPEVGSADVKHHGQPWDVTHKKPGLLKSLISHAGYSSRLRGTPFSDLYRNRPTEVSGYLTGACLLILRTAWEEIGKFDENFYLYGEEVDWQQRARARGWSLKLVSSNGQPPVTHVGGATSAGEVAIQGRASDLLRANQALLLSKLYGRARSDVFLALLSVIDRLQTSKRHQMSLRERSKLRGSPSVVLTSNTLGFGGAERQRVLLANELVKRGYSVKFTCLQSLGPLVSELDHRVQLERRPWWLPPTTKASEATILVSGTTNTEVVHSYLWRALRHRRRWLVAAHTPPICPRTYSSLLSFGIRRSDGVIALDEAHWRELTASQKLNNSVSFAPNGVPKGTFHTFDTSNPPRFVTLGRITTVKGHSLLIDALARLPIDRQWTFHIYGDGPDREHLLSAIPARIADRVRWYGSVSGPDAVFQPSDILCLPSEREAQPLVILEAMMRGVPVIASAVCSVPQMLDNGRVGILVHTRTVEEWRDALDRVLCGREPLEHMAGEAAGHVRARYTVREMTDAYVSILNRSVTRVSNK